MVHCGHPTALHPWALYDPKGRMVCTGVLNATHPNPLHGTAWDSIDQAFAWVEVLTRVGTDVWRRIHECECPACKAWAGVTS